MIIQIGLKVKNQIDDWTKSYSTQQDQKGMSFPSEYVIRIFKGHYPRLDFSKMGGYKGKSILGVFQKAPFLLYTF